MALHMHVLGFFTGKVAEILGHLSGKITDLFMYYKNIVMYGTRIYMFWILILCLTMQDRIAE